VQHCIGSILFVQQLESPFLNIESIQI